MFDQSKINFVIGLEGLDKSNAIENSPKKSSTRTNRSSIRFDFLAPVKKC